MHGETVGRKKNYENVFIREKENTYPLGPLVVLEPWHEST